MSTLIVPCAGRSSRYPGLRPKWLLTHPDGKLMIQKALSGFNFKSYDRIIFTIVKEHSIKFDAEIILKEVFPDANVEVHVLENFTKSAAETVVLTLREKKVSGAFIIKDSDNFVGFDAPENTENFVVGLDLNTFGDVSNITGKSFLILNEQDILIDIIEKQVRSNIICLGVYAISSAEQFCSAYDEVSNQIDVSGELYVSHILSWMISLKHDAFNYVPATGFEDWGTLSDWKNVTTKHQTYFVDIDGVLIKNTGKYGKNNWSNNREVLLHNIEKVKKLQENGAQIILVTSRPEDYREMISQIMNEHGLSFYTLIMGCHHARRVIINDFAPSNPYPSCVAVNIPRDGKLEDYI